MPILVEMKGITKSFPGVKALVNANLDIKSGEVHVMLGENGAGKSTLMKILTGVFKKDSGTIIIQGKEIEAESPKHAQELGISIIYQEFNLLPDMTVAENIFIAKEPMLFPGVIDSKKMNQESEKLLQSLNLKIKPTDLVSSLNVGEQQMVEIAKALSVDAKVLIMDEPTAALTESEIDELFRVIKKLRAKGTGIVYISHRMEELDIIADRVTVMRDGQYIGTVDYKSTTIDKLITMMVGRTLESQYPQRDVPIGNELLTIQNLSTKAKLRDVNFSVKSGEILGIAGIMGAGRTETARAIFGADKLTSGKFLLNGKEISIKSPTDAIKNGIAYLTEDRKKDGLLLDQSVEDNIMIANWNEYSNQFSMCDYAESSKICNSYVEKMEIKTPSLKQEIKYLSGGNQQKAILSRWICRKPKILIIDEPTRGIDVGAKREIYVLMNQLVAEGAAIIMISSDLPEIMGMSDRVIVMHEGAVKKILNKEEATQEKIIYYATGN